MMSLTLETALRTPKAELLAALASSNNHPVSCVPFPAHLDLSPSRSSIASLEPLLSLVVCDPGSVKRLTSRGSRRDDSPVKTSLGDNVNLDLRLC